MTPPNTELDAFLAESMGWPFWLGKSPEPPSWPAFLRDGKRLWKYNSVAVGDRSSWSPSTCFDNLLECLCHHGLGALGWHIHDEGVHISHGGYTTYVYKSHPPSPDVVTLAAATALARALGWRGESE